MMMEKMKSLILRFTTNMLDAVRNDLVLGVGYNDKRGKVRNRMPASVCVCV